MEAQTNRLAELVDLIRGDEPVTGFTYEAGKDGAEEQTRRPMSRNAYYAVKRGRYIPSLSVLKKLSEYRPSSGVTYEALLEAASTQRSVSEGKRNGKNTEFLRSLAERAVGEYLTAKTGSDSYIKLLTGDLAASPACPSIVISGETKYVLYLIPERYIISQTAELLPPYPEVLRSVRLGLRIQKYIIAVTTKEEYDYITSRHELPSADISVMRISKDTHRVEECRHFTEENG